ncbi:MAG: hypothetical protein MUP47_10790 [Phycisphaerae bacterium]|nr:hypothetical protein [Phycisphaerae bacterium]
MSAGSEILQDLVSALRACEQFAVVTLGDSADTAVPRAAVHHQGQDFFPADDRPDGRHVRLRCRVVIHTRCAQAAEQAQRELDLAAAAAEALLADPYRGGRCVDLPIGKATEVGQVEPSGTSHRPEVETTFTVRCHYELTGSQA